MAEHKTRDASSDPWMAATQIPYKLSTELSSTSPHPPPPTALLVHISTLANSTLNFAIIVDAVPQI